MHIDFQRDDQLEAPAIADPENVRTARFWHCKFRSLDFVSQLTNLEGLVVATYPDVSFDVLGSLTSLKYLRVLHLPKVSNIAPLAGLERLEVLSLATLPSWDSSGKTTEIDSLKPIALLPALRHVELFGVRTADRSLVPLEACPALASLRVSKWPKREVERFATAAGVSNDWAPRPWFLPD